MLPDIPQQVEKQAVKARIPHPGFPAKSACL
jgi:hypothetical protein